MTAVMPVVFTDRSRDRLRTIQGYIAFHNLRAAERVITRILGAAEMLGTFPDLGHPWESGPTRALSVPGMPYRIHYAVVPGERVVILAIAHTSQLPPEGL
jgi:plasmid stabilization system protein ParE